MVGQAVVEGLWGDGGQREEVSPGGPAVTKTLFCPSTV